MFLKVGMETILNNFATEHFVELLEPSRAFAVADTVKHRFSLICASNIIADGVSARHLVG